MKNFSIIKSYVLKRQYLLIIGFGIIGFVLPMLYGYFDGFPVPQVHDELSYLLAADTFASGRLTNPTPQFWHHFESPHLLFVPSYMSKYPPMQGLFLALGQVLFGHPIFGVWLSCGLAAASLFWMLSGWTKVKWAIFGTAFMILMIGIDNYWAQSYWGGMVAAAGGMLFFGGFRRLFKKLSPGSALLMVLGGIILVNSRPFEGFLTMLPALFVLAVWLLRTKKNTLSEKVLRAVLPAVLLAGVGVSAMLYYNYQVTGNVFTLPYAEHQKQYYPTPLFIFQSIDTQATSGHPRLRKIYDTVTVPMCLQSIYKEFDLNPTLYLRPLYAFSLQLLFLPHFLLSPALLVFLYAIVPFFMFKSRWSFLLVMTILFTFACMSFATWWDNYHYSAPLTGCFYLLLVQSFRYFLIMMKKNKNSRKTTVYALFFLLISSSIIYWQVLIIQFPSIKADTNINSSNISEQLAAGNSVKLTISKRATVMKPAIEKAIDTLDGKYLAIVTYDNAFDFNDEIVYNRADLDNAKIIWAYDLGEKNDQDLINYYSDRKVLRVMITPSAINITPKNSE